jgi:hypothetical protein
MDSLVFPRTLWRRRIIVSLGAVLAIAAAAKFAAGSGDGGARAEVRVLLDTPQSQLINADPARVESLPWRATLLSQLLGTEPARRQIAGEAGIPANRLAVVNSDLATPILPAALSLTAAEAAAYPHEAYVLSVHSDATIPLISLEAQAPDRGAATRLAEAAAHALKISAAPADMPEARSFIAEPVGPITTRSLAAGHRTLLVLGVATFLFGLWCAGVMLVYAIARSIRLPETKPAPRPTK